MNQSSLLKLTPLIAPKLKFRAKCDCLEQPVHKDKDNNSRDMVIIIPESVMTCILPLKGDKEKKRLELLERKKENQRLLDEESARIKGKSQKELMCGGKVTRAQIEEALQAEQLKQEQLEIRPKGQSIPDNSAVKHHLSLFKIKFYSHRNDPPGDSSGGEHKQNCSR